MRAIATRSFTALKETAELWLSMNAFQHAGALAFYTLFSLAPMLIIIIAIVGAVLGAEAARAEVYTQVEVLLGAQAAAAVDEAVHRSRLDQGGLLPTLLGGGMLLFGATTVLAQMQSSLNQFWGVRARPSRSGLLVFATTRLLSLGLVLIIGFLLLTSFVISMGLAAVIRFAEAWIPIPPPAVTAADLALSLLVASLVFAAIFKFLPDVRLQWRDMWKGAGLTAVLFVTGQFLISLYLTHTAPASTYGAAGSLVMVLLWVYYSSLLLFFGAAFTRVSVRRRGDRIVPKPTAVRMRTEIVEEVE
jgi:membrane protein